jgi:hypothetical protein
MCHPCGCKSPYEDHGDQANIVEEDLKRAGQTETIKSAGIQAAKENMLELILLQRNAGDLQRPRKDHNE